MDTAKQAYYEESLEESGSTDTTGNPTASSVLGAVTELARKSKAEEAELDGSVSPKEVGHHIYILAHQLSQHNRALEELLKLGASDSYTDQALDYYAKHTAQIEVNIVSCCWFSSSIWFRRK